VRYNRAQDSPSPTNKEIPEVVEESEVMSLFNQSSIQKLGYRRRGRAFKDNSRIVGDLSKAAILQDSSLIGKKVAFQAFSSERDLAEHSRAFSRKQEVASAAWASKPGVRPLTAKVHYDNTVKRMVSRQSQRRSIKNLSSDMGRNAVKKYSPKHHDYSDTHHHGNSKASFVVRRSFVIKQRSSSRERITSACRLARLSNDFERNYKTDSHRNTSQR